MSSFEKQLDQYAKTIVEVGVNVQSGQEVVVSAFTESVDLVRLVAKHAYERGAKNVHIRWSDGVLTRLKYEHAPQDVFEQFPEWEAQMMETIAKRGGAFITILSESPDLLSGIDSKKLLHSKKLQVQHFIHIVNTFNLTKLHGQSSGLHQKIGRKRFS